MFYDNELFHTSIGFDMRAPDFGAPAPDIYAAAMEMISYADARGIDKVDFQAASGFLDWPFGDGFGPAPMPGTLSAMFSRVG